MPELRTDPRNTWDDGDRTVPPDSWGRDTAPGLSLPWGFTLVVVLLVVGRSVLTPHLTSPALQTWATIFVAICVQALPFLVFGVALSAAITAFVPAAFWTRALPGHPAAAVPVAIERGDVVVFSGVDSWDGEVKLQEPSNPVAAFFRWVGTAFGVVPGEKDYIKRVIGVPGDTVKCCDAQGRITVNGVPLDERAYLHPSDEPARDPFEVKVPPGRLWVMGDHRSVSLDSRSHLGDPGGGTIPVDKVIGRAFVIVWPFSRAAIIPIPDTFNQPALKAAVAVGEAAPFALGLAGAAPLLLWRRRRRSRR